MKKVELLLPAGNEECLRAAVANGADAVYFGLSTFNARASATNFCPETLASVIEYCHNHNVKVYITFNILVKNAELKDYFSLMNAAYIAKADAVIIQDTSFIQCIRKNFPKLQIHISTQATTINSYSVPHGADRIILARELVLDEIREISNKIETEVFVHGALCCSYSGQCLISSLASGRSGNRGRCLQLCRKKYNNKYVLSTMDLCLVEKIPVLISSGVTAFKIEGRLRSPLYVATVARIYRKYIDLYYAGTFSIDENDIDELKMAFNREFTQGFAFTDSVVDAQKPGNRGLYLGQYTNGNIMLKKGLKVGDGIGIWLKDEVVGQRIKRISKDGASVTEAFSGDTVNLGLPYTAVAIYKTSTEANINLGDELRKYIYAIKQRKIVLPELVSKENKDKPRLFAKVYTKKSALAADEFADVIYYDIFQEDCTEVKKSLKHALFFVYTPRIVSDEQIRDIVARIDTLKPAGVLVGNRGFLEFLKGTTLHLDYSFNCFNDIDLTHFPGIPIISPELNFKETISLHNKNFIVMVHGNIVVMATKQKIKAPELIDEEDRHFTVRSYNGMYEILNCKQLGLFTKMRDYINHGIKYFYLDVYDAKYVKFYRKILENTFDDSKIKKGFTKGHFDRGVI